MYVNKFKTKIIQKCVFITLLSGYFFLFQVALILGISGACRKQELIQLTIDDVEDIGSVAVFKLKNTKNKSSRSFHINGLFYQIYEKYVKLRPQTTQKRLFLNYKNGKCTQQVVGINKIGKVPQTVAKFLKLKSPELYTGHSLRRSSATILVDAGGDLNTLKRHGGWKSSSVAEGYIDDSAKKRTIIASKIQGAINSYSSSENMSPKPQCSTSNQPNQISDEIFIPDLEPKPSVSVVNSNGTEREWSNSIIFPVNSQVSNQETTENNLHHAPVHFVNCSNNTFTFNFYKYPEKK